MAHADNVTADQLIAGCNVLSKPAEEFDNDETVQLMWAMKAMEHAEIYFNILCSVDPTFLKLTSHDVHIYRLFRDTFPNMKIDKIQEDELKSLEAKKKWRLFCEQFKEAVEDYNFGTLIRLDCTEDYSEQNSILTTRIQFYAIELARNKEGLNDGLRKKYRSKKTDKE